MMGPFLTRGSEVPREREINQGGSNDLIIVVYRLLTPLLTFSRRLFIPPRVYFFFFAPWPTWPDVNRRSSSGRSWIVFYVGPGSAVHANGRVRKSFTDLNS